MTYITGNAILTGTTIQARLLSTIVYVNFTIFSFESINTNTRISTVCIGTCSSILTYIWTNGTLIDIFSTILSCVFWRTIACVSIKSVDTFSTILTEMTIAIVYIDLTTSTSKSWKYNMFLKSGNVFMGQLICLGPFINKVDRFLGILTPLS